MTAGVAEMEKAFRRQSKGTGCSAGDHLVHFNISEGYNFERVREIGRTYSLETERKTVSERYDSD